MSDQLKNILHFTAGGPTSLPHGLKVGNLPLIPDHIELSVMDAGGVITADDVNVTISTSATVDILVESWHTIERAFGDVAIEALSPQPFVLGQGSPTPAFAVGTTTIYARTTGNDTTGNGTLAKPYLTMQRAVRDIPNTPPPGANYVVDITGITETLPVDYQFPQIETTNIGGWLAGPSAQPAYEAEGGVTFRALPKVVALSPASDATITAAVITTNPISNLIKVTDATKSWTPGALKGKQVARTVKSGSSSASTCVIYDNTATELFLCNTAGDFGAISPADPVQIVEPSATLIGSPASRGWGVTMQCWAINSIRFQGIHFEAPLGFQALGMGRAAIPYFELCVIDGLMAQDTPNEIALLGTVVTNSFDLEPCPAVVVRSLFKDFTGGYIYLAAILQTFLQTVFDDTVPTITSGYFHTPLPSNWGFNNVLFQGSQGDAIHADNGRWDLLNVEINDSQGNGITVNTGPAYAKLTNVGGTGNTGIGVVADDGVMVQVDATTAITGTGGDYQSGSLAAQPAGSWPTLSNLTGYDVIGATGAVFADITGTRIFAK